VSCSHHLSGDPEQLVTVGLEMVWLKALFAGFVMQAFRGLHRTVVDTMDRDPTFVHVAPYVDTGVALDTVGVALDLDLELMPIQGEDLLVIHALRTGTDLERNPLD
jgi:hypothetical protein